MNSRTGVTQLHALEGEAVGARDGAGQDAVGPAVAVAGVGVEVCRPAVVVVKAVASGVHDVAALAIPAWDPLPVASGQFVHVQLARLRRRSAEDQHHNQGSSRSGEKLASRGHYRAKGISKAQDCFVV